MTSKRSKAMKASWRRRKNSARTDITAIPADIADMDTLRTKTEHALGLLQDGIAQVNEAWDILNSIPKRIK